MSLYWIIRFLMANVMSCPFVRHTHTKVEELEKNKPLMYRHDFIHSKQYVHLKNRHTTFEQKQLGCLFRHLLPDEVQHNADSVCTSLSLLNANIVETLNTT